MKLAPKPEQKKLRKKNGENVSVRVQATADAKHLQRLITWEATVQEQKDNNIKSIAWVVTPKHRGFCDARWRTLAGFAGFVRPGAADSYVLGWQYCACVRPTLQRSACICGYVVLL